VNDAFPVDVHQELARGERPSHLAGIFALVVAIGVLTLAAVYGGAFIGGIGTKLGLAVVVDHAFTVGASLAAALAIVSLKWLRFIRLPFRFAWAALASLALLVVAVSFSPLVDEKADPIDRAFAPLSRLLMQADAAYARNVQMPALDDQRAGERPVDSDRALTELPPVAPADTPPPKKPEGHVRAAEDGAFEWAWTDAEGGLHVTSTPPPEGARVISKTKKR